MGFTFREELVNGQLPYQAGDRFARVSRASAVRAIRSNPPSSSITRSAIAPRASSMSAPSASDRSRCARGPGEVESIHGTLPHAALDGVARGVADRRPHVDCRRWRAGRRARWSSSTRACGGTAMAADPAMIGRQLIVGGQPRTVVGIMPESFRFPSSGELWVPLDELNFGLHSITRTARMLGGAASRRVLRSARMWRSTHWPVRWARSRRDRRNSRVHGASVHGATPIRPTPRPRPWWSMLVMVLLVVASNVATLVFARTWARAPELAVRTALGAARTRVVGQLFFETLLLGSIATAIGATGAFAILRYIRGLHGRHPVLGDAAADVAHHRVRGRSSRCWSASSRGLFPALKRDRVTIFATRCKPDVALLAGGFGKIGRGAAGRSRLRSSVGLLNGAVTHGARRSSRYVAEVPALAANQVLTRPARKHPIGREARRHRRRRRRPCPVSIAAGAGERLPRLYATAQADGARAGRR